MSDKIYRCSLGDRPLKDIPFTSVTDGITLKMGTISVSEGKASFRGSPNWSLDATELKEAAKAVEDVQHYYDNVIKKAFK